jgi:hypothetical protein
MESIGSLKKSYKHMKQILISCLFALSLIPLQVQAQTVLQLDLYYDPRTNFRVDRFIEEPIQILENGQTNAVSESEGDYYAIYISSSGKTIDDQRYYFTPEDDAFQLTLPYQAQASGVRFFESGRTTLLSQLDILEFSKCNQDGVCAYEEGETIELCPQDCLRTTPVFSAQTQKLLEEGGGQIVTEDGTTLIKESPLEKTPEPISTDLTTSRRNRNQATMVLGGIVVGGLVFGGVIYKLYKK